MAPIWAVAKKLSRKKWELGLSMQTRCPFFTPSFRSAFDNRFTRSAYWR